MIPNPAYGAPEHLGIALLVLITILLITKFFRGFVANVSVLLGIIVGFLIALAMGKVSFAGTGEAAWVAFVYPFQFGLPTFDLVVWAIVRAAWTSARAAGESGSVTTMGRPSSPPSRPPSTPTT